MEYLFTHTPLHFFVQSFWRDEAFTYLLAHKPILEILSLTARDFNPPLYYVVLHYWIMVAGKSEIAIRTLSFLGFWGVMYVAYYIMRDMMKFSVKKSSLYLLFMLINPILVYYAFEARMYSIFAFLAALSMYAFYTKKWKLYYVATIAGLYTHYFMLLVVFSQLVYSYFFDKESRKDLFIIGKAIAALIPWIIYVFAVKPVFSEQFWILKPQIFDLLYMPAQLFTGYEKDLGYLQVGTGGIIWFLLVFSLFAYYIYYTGYKLTPHSKNARAHHLFGYLSIWALGGPLLVFVLSPIKALYLTRYLIYAAPGIALLLIYCVDHMKKAPKVVLIAVLFLMTWSYQGIQIKNRTKTDLSKPIREIAYIAKPSDMLFVTSELDYFTAQYYFVPDRVYIYGKTYREIPSYVGKVMIPPSRIAPMLPAYPIKAFVMDSYGNYEIKAAQ